MLQTTVGQLLINAALPEDLHAYDHRLDKKGIAELMTRVAERHPDKYKDVVQRLMSLGHYNAQAAGTSLRLTDMLPPPEVERKLVGLRAIVEQLNQSDLPQADKEKKITDLVLAASGPLEREIYETGLKNGNQLAMQVHSGSRGNPTQLKQIVAGDMLVEDHHDRIIPVPILHGYAEGLTPAEYFAASYGARKGTASTKFATAEAGFFGKQLAMIGHRLTVTEKDCGAENGLPVPGDDPDNVGSVLARPVASHPAGTVVTPAVLKDLRGKNVLVRSPTTCQSRHGVCAKCAGVREKGGFPAVGENVGMAAAQAVGEPMAQGMLSAKHGGGAVGNAPKQSSGFDYVNQLIQVPKTFRNAAAVADVEGRIEQVTDAPQGGKYVLVAGRPHYVPPGLEVTVKTGQKVEAGDVLSEGTPNPADVVRHKGIGEGRRQFVHTFGQALAASGVKAHRRNLELLARGLINHVKVSDLDGVVDAMPDDVLSYDHVARHYRPRPDAQLMPTHRAEGKYLERPALHYSIGTRITPGVAKTLAENQVPEVLTHDREPPFTPHMVRGMEAGLKDTNWVTRLGGSYLEKGFLESVHRGRNSSVHDTSYYPGLSKGMEFGKSLKETGMY